MEPAVMEGPAYSVEAVGASTGRGRSGHCPAVVPHALLRYIAVDDALLGNRPTILVADNDPDTLLLLEDLLIDEGYAVVTAEDGREALRLAGSRPVDLILLNHTMPHLSAAAFCAT